MLDQSNLLIIPPAALVLWSFVISQTELTIYLSDDFFVEVQESMKVRGTGDTVLLAITKYEYEAQ